jgi:Tol biopolymer transport system component/serine/threonine protein kinase
MELGPAPLIAPCACRAETGNSFSSSAGGIMQQQERDKLVEQLFEAALALDDARRAAFLDNACALDPQLLEEVQSLLSAYEQSAGFMESPAYEVAAGLIVEQPGQSLMGCRLGHYEIRSYIGAGGMGEVYRACDTRLGRDVAIKVLPEALAHSQPRLQGLDQEARAASALSHPNICVIYEVGETADNRHFIAMEYIEGLTLRELLAQRPLDLKQLLDVAIQIASALAAAHAAGVVHRDIKPENIMVRRDGYVKVLDFGLAKFTPERATTPEALARSPFVTDQRMVMGTACYMAPEQVRGLAVDARTDLWSLGVVLYEMLAGHPPFARRTIGDVVAAILEQEPAPLRRDLGRAPEALECLVSKALRKDRNQRYQTAEEMLADLSSLRRRLEADAEIDRSVWPGLYIGKTSRTSGGQGMPQAVVTSADPQVAGAAIAGPRFWAEHLTATFNRRRTWAAALASVMVIIIVGLALRSWKGGAHPTGAERASAMKIVPITSLRGLESGIAFSPDGSQIAFSWNKDAGYQYGVYVKPIGQETARQLTDHGYGPTWSPDGQQLAFMRIASTDASGIFIVSAAGGPARKLHTVGWRATDHPHHRVHWSPDGQLIAFCAPSSDRKPEAIYLLSVADRHVSQLTFPPDDSFGDQQAVFSPDGKTVAFVRESHELAADIYLVNLDGGEPTRMTFDNAHIWGLTWHPNGREIVFCSQREGQLRLALYRISIAGGQPEKIPISSELAFHPEISRQGDRLAYVQDSYDLNIWRVDLSRSRGQKAVWTKLISSTLREASPQISPDGRKIVFESGRSGYSEIWACDADGTNPVRLTSFSSGTVTDSPRWSPDAGAVVFSARLEGHSDIFIIDVRGEQLRRLTTDPGDELVPSWSRDGCSIYFAANRRGQWQVWKMPAAGGEAVAVTRHGGYAAFESPDGESLYFSKAPMQGGIWAMPAGGGEEQLVIDRPQVPYLDNWAVGSRAIYFLDLAAGAFPTIQCLDLATRKVTAIASLTTQVPPWVSGVSLSADERWLLCAQVDEHAEDVMLVENFR